MTAGSFRKTPAFATCDGGQSFNAHPEAPALVAKSPTFGAGAFGWAFNEQLKVALSYWAKKSRPGRLTRSRRPVINRGAPAVGAGMAVWSSGPKTVYFDRRES